MNILITGTNGFIAKELYNYFILKNHNVVCISRSSTPSIDLTDKFSTNNYFKNKYFDVVLHTSIIGSKKEQRNLPSTLINNLLMFNNIIDNKQNYNLLFNFCSGAALVEDENIGCFEAKEEQILSCIPKNYYGLSKNIIARQIYNFDYVYNLRLFGCFGIHEDDTRFIKNCILNIKNKKSPIVHQNKQMDFFYIKDLCLVVEYIMKFYNNKNIPKDINLVYQNKINLIDILNYTFDLTNTKQDFILNETQTANPYTGNGDKLQNLNLSLNGLKFGINEVINNVF